MRRILLRIIVLSLISLTSCNKNLLIGDLIITNVNIIDVENFQTLTNQTIVIQNGIIISIQPYLKSDKIKSEVTIDGTNKYLIPALWDMHAHYTTSKQHPNFRSLFIANGVLGVRDLWGNLDKRDSLVASKSLMPRTYLSGDIIDGPFTLLQGTTIPKSPEDAARIVDSLHQKGADFIKVYDDLSKEIYEAIANKCTELDFPFVGHTPNDLKAAQASQLGQKSIEHLNGIFESASSQQEKIDSLENEFKQYFIQRNIPKAINTFTTIGQLLSSSYDDDLLSELAAILKFNNTYITPTLITHYNQWYRRDKKISSHPNLKYIPQQMLEEWDPNNEFPTQLFNQETWDSGKNLVAIAKKITAKLNEKGVKILAGTDCGNFYIIPGFSLHEELELLVNSGLNNAEALQTATLNPAIYFKMTDSLGTVAKNKIADLILLNGNPLDNISNTKKIIAVIKRGEYLNRIKLDEILKKAESNL